VILVTGASGFVGRHVTAALAGQPVRLTAHRRPVPGATAVDLTDPATLRGLCDGVSAVIHLASYIGDNPHACAAVNARGTAALLAEAEQAGVNRFLYLSTAAVYGNGTHRGPAEDQLAPAPVSVLSRSRLAAEHAVRAAGGTVLRPMFIYGPGDIWFIPQLARLLTVAPASLNGGRARISLVAAGDLAAAIAVLAAGTAAARVFHAAHPEPVTLRELHQALVRCLGVPAPRAEVSYDDAMALIGPTDPALAQRISLLAFDHYYDGARLWAETGVQPGSFGQCFPRYAAWYRAHLGGNA